MFDKTTENLCYPEINLAKLHDNFRVQSKRQMRFLTTHHIKINT